MADSGGTDYTGLLGLLGAAAISSAGAIYNNYQQRKLVGATNDMAVNLANTAHQREVADLYAAGLNPILSAGGNGAPTPSLGTANLDNVLSSFGSSASSFGKFLSKQRSLENDAVAEGVEGQRLENSRLSQTLPYDVSSAKSEAKARQSAAEYENTLAQDRLVALNSMRSTPMFSDGRYVMDKMNDSYLKTISDSVKSDLARPHREATQSWINTGKGIADTVLNSAKTVNDFRRPKGKIINHFISP